LKPVHPDNGKVLAFLASWEVSAATLSVNSQTLYNRFALSPVVQLVLLTLSAETRLWT